MAIRDQLARYCYTLKFEDLPHDVVEFTRLLIMDQVGLTIAGARSYLKEGYPDLARSVKELGGKEESSLVGEGCKAPCADAAFSNTTVSFGGFDGLHASVIHLSSCLIPATIAVAERQQATGKNVILATVIGSDIIARIAWALGSNNVYDRGFHPTSLCASFGCAAAAGKLLGLGQEALAEALSIAAPQAAGSSSQPQLPHTRGKAAIQVGRAAQSGVNAALMAQTGAVGTRDIFENPQGFLASHSARPNIARLTEGLGTVFEVKNTTIKRFGVGIYNLPGIEALLYLLQKHDIRPEDIARMTYRLPTAVVPLVGSPDYPSTNNSNLSARYVLAITAYKGEDGMLFNLDYKTEANLKDTRHMELFKLIDVVAEPDLDKFFPGKWPCVLTVKTKDGREFSRLHDQPLRGEPENPLTQAEIQTRFNKAVAPVLHRQTCDRMLEILRRLEDVNDVSELARLMASK